MDRNMKFFSQKVAKAFLENPDGELGEGIGDPAGCNRDGDVGAKSHRSDGREDHLADNREHRHKKSDGEAGGNGVPAGVPEFAVEDGAQNFAEPGTAPHFRAAQEAVSAPDKSEISFFEFNAHTVVPLLEDSVREGEILQVIAYQRASNSLLLRMARIWVSLSETSLVQG